ncbi:MAG: hypothetical protein IT480_13425 [Gammaproteobacteria bacterium]|nr:hypothetical protein [Gammaproteobacteria bacterium]
MTAPFKLISRQEAMAITGLPESTMALLIRRGEMPAPQPLSTGGRRKFWHPDVFFPWLDERLKKPGGPLSQPPVPLPAERSSRRAKSPVGAVMSSEARHAARIAELNQ